MDRSRRPRAGKLESSSPRKTQLAYQQQGKCTQCGQRKPHTKTLCKPCAKNHAAATVASNRRRIGEDLCPQCGTAPLLTQRFCKNCLNAHNERTRREREELRKQKRCRDCRQPAGEYVRCEECRLKQRQAREVRET